MTFGNWEVTNDSITWKGDDLGRFEIPANELVATAQYGNDETLYKWVLLATDEDWLTQNDLYDLNYAFVFAAAKFNARFDYNIFDATLAEQYELFEQEDNEEDT